MNYFDGTMDKVYEIQCVYKPAVKKVGICWII